MVAKKKMENGECAQTSLTLTSYLKDDFPLARID
jgi:hypothetical protein